MLATFESILPIFLLIVAGGLLKHFPAISEAAWSGLEQFSFWFLYPTLLFVTIANADFGGLELDAMMSALLFSVALMCVGVYALWPLLDRAKLVTAAEFSSVYQTAIRWNGFMALAIAQKIFPPAGAAVVGLVMAVIIVPINIATIFVLTRFADRNASWSKVAKGIATNPLLVGTVLGLFARLIPGGLYAPVNEALKIVGDAALGAGLIAIGGGLRINDIFRPRFPVWLPVLLKLVLFPVLLVSLAVLFGVTGGQLSYVALCAAVPTAMNGYLLARQLGGDAELYAAVTTVQTALSFFTIPAVLQATDYIAG